MYEIRILTFEHNFLIFVSVDRESTFFTFLWSRNSFRYPFPPPQFPPNINPQFSHNRSHRLESSYKNSTYKESFVRGLIPSVFDRTRQFFFLSLDDSYTMYRFLVKRPKIRHTAEEIKHLCVKIVVPAIQRYFFVCRFTCTLFP